MILYVHPKKIKASKRKEHEGKKTKQKRDRKKRRKKNETNMRSGLRPSPEDTVAVFRYDQSNGISSWRNIRMAHEDQSEARRQEKGRDEELITNTKRAVLCPADG